MITKKFSDYLEHVYKNERVFVFDVETTLIPKGKGESIYNKPPSLVMWDSFSVEKGEFYSEHAAEFRTAEDLSDYVRIPHPTYNDMLVGHNIGYDIYMGLISGPNPAIPEQTFIWDTMLAAYLLSNQELRSPSLNETALYFGLTEQKEDEVSQMIKSGICPSTIDPVKLAAYLRQDILLTKDVYLKQREQFLAKPKPWQMMFINQMFFLAKTIRASFNGIKIDQTFVSSQSASLTGRAITLAVDLVNHMSAFTVIDQQYWNPASNNDLQIVLYGGKKKIEKRVANGVYKTGAKAGQTKYKIEKLEITVRGAVEEVGSQATVDEAKLKELLKDFDPTNPWHKFISNLLEYRDVCKNLGTYYEGYMSYADKDGFIHPQFHHTRTPTGRLTCTNPNLQNIKS